MIPEQVLFIIGAITFLFTFAWFKAAAMVVFKSEFIKNSSSLTNTWKKLFKVFFVDLFICSIGVIGTGAMFIFIFKNLPL